MRAMWIGMVQFGLVSVPIAMYTAVREDNISFSQVTAEGKKVSQKRVDPDGKEVAYEDIKKGYEIGEGEYLIINPADLQALEPLSSKVIDVSCFVSPDEIDPIYWNKTYHLGPGKAGEKGYRLLVLALAEKNVIGIGRVCMRQREYLVAIRSINGALRAMTMHYKPEIVYEGAIPRLNDGVASADEVGMACMLIDSMTKQFDPSEYRNEYQESVSKLIEARLNEVEPEAREAGEKKSLPTDIMAALQASLKEVKEEVNG